MEVRLWVYRSYKPLLRTIRFYKNNKTWLGQANVLTGISFHQ